MVSPGNLVVAAVALLLLVGSAAWVVRHYALPTVLAREARVLRVDRRALAVGAVLLVVAGAAVAPLVDLAAPVVSLTVALLAVVGVACLTVGVANLDWYRAARRPVATPATAEPGPVQLEGTVTAVDAPVVSSVTQTDAAAYRAATLEEHAVLGRGYQNTTWSPVSAAFDATAFELGDDGAPSGRRPDASTETDAAATDGDATVTVEPSTDAFPLLAPDARVLEFTPASKPLDGLTRTVSAEPGTTVPIGDDLERGARPRPRRYVERRIDPGNDVYVLGTAERDGDGLRVVDDPDGPPLLVTRLGADDARSHARHLVLGYGGAGAVALAVAAALAWLYLV